MLKECIFVVSYPNTDQKREILKKCILSLKKTNLPVVLVSNIEIPEDIKSIANHYLDGKNIDCRYEDYFSREEIDYARNHNKYLLDFSYGGEVITYRPFHYGYGSTYHWSALKQRDLIISFCKENNIINYFTLEGDTVLDEADVFLIREGFDQMEEEDLDFILALENNLGHICPDFLFISTAHAERIFSGFTALEFLKSTYPQWSAETYIFHRMKKYKGKGKILKWSSDPISTEDFPSTWKIEEKESPKGFVPKSINILFENTSETWLSSSIDSEDQNLSEPLSYVLMGTGKKSDLPVFFIWNRYNREIVKEINAKITIFNGESVTFNSDYNLFPGGWAWSPIFNLKRDSYCKVEIIVTDFNGGNFYFSDRFGSVGDSINMRDIILE